MTDTLIIQGGPAVPSPTLVQADQVTIVGDGSHERPLHAAPGSLGIAVRDEGTPVAGNPHTALNFVGAGVTASNAGGGVADVTIPGGVTIRDEGTPIAGNPHQSINFVGAGVTATDAGGGVATVTIPGSAGSGSTVLLWGVGTWTTVPAFVQPGGTNLDPSSTSDFAFAAPFSGTLRNMYVRHNTAGGSGPVATYTVLVNGSPTSLTVSLATGALGQASDLVHSVAVNAGDLIELTVTSLSIGPNRTDAKISVQFGP